TPNWVSYNLEQSHLATGVDRCNCFTFDPELPQARRYTTNEYTGVGDIYNRGHLTRSSDRTTGTLDNARTYYFSNVIPQAADNNQGPWAVLETYLGDLARNSDKEVYIIAGVAGNLGTLKNLGNVVIPANVWKVAVIMPRNQGLANLTSLTSAEVIAVIMPNINGIKGVPWTTYRTTVDAVESLSGYDLLALIRDDLEIAIESDTKFPVAATNGPFTEVVGTSIPMSAAGSTDPDGDALTFVWSFGDGSVASGVNATHTYSTSGLFTVRLIATDTRGLADTVFTTANVLSAAVALERAIVLLDLLEANGTLDKGEANSLGAKLRNAHKQAERGKNQPALGMLGAFMNHLDAMVKTGRVTEASVAELRSLVQRSIVALQL
ncbi:MAG: DNA/RNA non-specific endonuclease, partial [Gemmatimonas sp.]